MATDSKTVSVVSAPRDMLKREQIEEAKNNRNHIVIRTFDGLRMPHWGALLESLRTNSDNQQQQVLCQRAVIPFAEALNGNVFTLKPLEIVSIWSRVTEILPSTYASYSLSTAIACAYGAMPIKSEDWKHLFRNMYEGGACYEYLEDIATKDKINAIVFRQRLGDISTSYDELDYYSYGTREEMCDLAEKAYRHGDKEAEERFDRMVQWQKAHKDEVLGKIHENWGNGIFWMFNVLPREQKVE